MIFEETDPTLRDEVVTRILASTTKQARTWAAVAVAVSVAMSVLQVPSVLAVGVDGFIPAQCDTSVASCAVTGSFEATKPTESPPTAETALSQDTGVLDAWRALAAAAGQDLEDLLNAAASIMPEKLGAGRYANVEELALKLAEDDMFAMDSEKKS